MPAGWAGVIELALVFGVVLGLAGWELWRLRREQKRDAEKAKDDPPL